MEIEVQRICSRICRASVRILWIVGREPYKKYNHCLSTNTTAVVQIFKLTFVVGISYCPCNAAGNAF